MPMFIGEFTFKVEEYGEVTLEADNEEQADEFVREHIRESYPDAMNIEVNSLREIAV